MDFTCEYDVENGGEGAWFKETLFPDPIIRFKCSFPASKLPVSFYENNIPSFIHSGSNLCLRAVQLPYDETK